MLFSQLEHHNKEVLLCQVTTALDYFYDVAPRLGLKGVRRRITELRSLIERRHDPDTKDKFLETFKHRIGSLALVICEQLEDQKFFFLSMGETELFNHTPRSYFTDKVVDAFPASEDDLMESLQCAAFGRHTSSVFHLMRALETPLKMLWLATGNTNKQPHSWNDYINQIAASSGNAGRPSAEKSFLQKMVLHLGAVKDVWRNPTMHDVAQHYDEQQRSRIALVVHGMLIELSSGVDSNGFV